MNSLSASLMLLPTFFCAYYAVRGYLRWGKYLIAAVCFAYTGLSMPVLRVVQDVTGMHDNRAILLFIALFFAIFWQSTSLLPGRCLLIYLWAAVFMTFPSNVGYIVDAITHTEHMQMDFGPDVLLIQCIMTLTICGGVYIATNLWDARVLSPADTPESVWYSWMSIPVLFLAMNIAMIPADYRTIRAFRMYRLYALFTVCLLLLYIYLTAIFYSFMIEYIHIREFEAAEHIHELRNLQFKNLQDQMSRDSRARHDFKHTLHVLTRLAASENWEELKQYLSNFAVSADNIIVKNYCANPALNAVLNYYAAKGEENEISTELQIDLPDEVPIDDIEFCSLLGNIMENAINACVLLPKEQRRLSISVLVKNAINLYIVSTNSYDGSLAGSDGNYISSKPEHKGIGLRSISETVDKYKGTMRIETDEKEFRLDIVMKLG